MGKNDFFDDFTVKIVLSADCIAKLNDLLVEQSDAGSSIEAARAAYLELLQQLLAAQGADIPAALADSPGFVYLEAATKPDLFGELMAQTAAAAQSANKSAAEAEAAVAAGAEVVPGTWEPPPADTHPETDTDYA